MATKSNDKVRESGLPGGGAGRREDVGASGVYPASGPRPKGPAPTVAAASWGQGKRGAAGYEDSGTSELQFDDVKPSLCRDLMTKDPACCVGSDSLEKAALSMRDHDIGELPVVELQLNKRLIGVVTDRDLVVRGVARGADPMNTNVESVMTRDITSCSPDHNVGQCLGIMEAKQVRRLPVVDDHGRVVGMISQADIALRLRDLRQTAEVVQEISRPRLNRRSR